MTRLDPEETTHIYTNNQDNDSSVNATRPSQIENPNRSNPDKSIRKNQRRRTIILGLLFILFVFAFTVTAGSIGGYISGQRTRRMAEQSASEESALEQYELGVADMSEGRLELARQRFEYVLSLDPSFPGVTDKLTDALLLLYSTATPSADLLTPTLSATRDPRPVQDLFAKSEGLLIGHNWTGAIDTLLSLRKEDPSYKVARVDGMLYLALRNRGLIKILKENDLGGGSYDLALAENFGPLDVDARNARNWARLYMIGSSFWEAIPEQAVYYFSQVASAAPYLRDVSGWTSIDRYQGALIQYGDQLAKQEEWCSAQTQYEIAYSIRADASLLALIEKAAIECDPSSSEEDEVTATMTPTITGSVTTTITATFFPPGTYTPTYTPTPTSTQTPELPPPTATPTPTDPGGETPTPTQTPVSPTDTPVPPEPPTETPTP